MKKWGKTSMNDMNLTKEEMKAIKRGHAYRAWNRTRRWTIIAFFIWGIGGIALVHINNVTSAIYTIGLLIGLIAMFYQVVISCWKCPGCKKKLPSKDVCGGSATVSVPVLVKNCPHCGADLTK